MTKPIIPDNLIVRAYYAHYPRAVKSLEMYALRELDPQTWTFSKIAQEYGTSKSNTHAIYHRLKKKLGSGIN